MQNICKRFGSLWANRDISLQVMPAEVHALVGENGAGKSTLMKILFGLIQPDGGSLYVNGKPVSFRHPREALQAGIGMVQQQMLIFPQLTSVENVVLGCEPRGWGLFREKEVERRLLELSRLFGFDLQLEAMAGTLSFAQRQQIELLRVLYRGARILILDEPTSLLSLPEVEKLLSLIKTLRAQGHTIIFISHRLQEVFSIADRITVLRKGKSIGTWKGDQISSEEIAALIMEESHPVSAGDSDRIRKKGFIQAAAVPMRPEPVLSLQQVTMPSKGSEGGLDDLSLQVREGEILGIGGVVGNGQRALARALAGLEKVDQGRILFQSREITGFPISRLVQLGFRWLPANSLEEGALPDSSLWENMLLGFQRKSVFQSWGWLHKRKIKDWTRQELNAGEVVHSSLQQSISSLSGGNQQKLVLSRALSDRPKLVILEQPGRGLDIHAQRRMHLKVKSLNREGVTFLVLSYDLEELLALSDSIGILYRGRLMGLVSSHEADRGLLGKWMLGLSG
jgi:simple sugar transport system ATP-binding protein